MLGLRAGFLLGIQEFLLLVSSFVGQDGVYVKLFLGCPRGTSKLAKEGQCGAHNPSVGSSIPGWSS